jgi:hypothetical protein
MPKKDGRRATDDITKTFGKEGDMQKVINSQFTWIPI